MSKKDKEFSDKLAKKIEEWSDSDCLKAFIKFFPRIQISTEFIQDNDSGLIAHQIMVVGCGDMVIPSEPMALPWPLQPANVPEEAKVNAN